MGREAAPAPIHSPTDSATYHPTGAASLFTGRVVIHHYGEEPEQLPARVLEACRRIDPQLIVLGSSEMADPRDARAQVPPTSHTKRLLSAQLGRALAESELHASLLVVLCPPDASPLSCPSSTSSRVPAPPSLAAAGSVSALGAPARSAMPQEVELRNLHLVEPEDGGTEDGYEEDDEDDGEEGEGKTAMPVSPPPLQGGGGSKDGRRQKSWVRQLSLRRGLSASSVPSASSLVSLEELMERGTIVP